MLALPFLLSSCATPPPQAFHNTDNTALVIKSIDQNTGQLLLPTASSPADNRDLFLQAKHLAQHQTAVVILENYTESRPGDQFRDRSFVWFAALRDLGYEHIYFLRGKGTSDPNGLPTLARYD